ncbi:lamin tail domain-containing protein [Candidatus Nanohalobium constans]|uniref:Lamin tail domain (LTD) n=1 Tax=Candidatus Nanohalobium constans TaxID=2565781 RepID=A0A5Q0UIS3_9ARCH|nr:lamin tail domain-containing protein [Candidatus Nanohalobium constans]QGA81040.1 lamin tail domain (LTD) [Candidatus Nanohalobium constans]
MTSHRESVVLAVIAVILVSIPAASQNVEISGEENKQGVIDSKFSDRFEVDFEPGKVVNDLMDSDARLEVNQSFSRDVKRLQTSKGFVKIVRTNDSIEKTVQTPYGRFEFGVKDGDNYSEFSGNSGSRDEAEEVRENLMDEMSQRSSELSEKHSVVVQEMLPDVSASVEDNSETEHLNLTNNEEEAVDISGWKAVSISGDSMEYMNLTGKLEPGETKTFFAGDEGRMENFGDNTVFKDVNIYSNALVKVYNAGEKEIVSLEY